MPDITPTPTGLDIETLRSLLEYDPVTGIFRRKTNHSVGKKGSVAGSLKNGYVKISVKDRAYRASRLAWFHYYGKWPDRFVDHKNRDRKDNSIENLRLATPGENQRNSKIRVDNTSGYRGVHFIKRTGLWEAQIKKDYRRRHLGYFEKPEYAALAYNAAAIEHHGEFASLNTVPSHD